MLSNEKLCDDKTQKAKTSTKMIMLQHVKNCCEKGLTSNRTLIFCVASNARDDYIITSSLPEMKLAQFSGDTVDWTEWSQLYQATVQAANMDDSVKMNHLKTMVTGTRKRPLLVRGTIAEMYIVAWNVRFRNFGKPQVAVNAQLKQIYSFPLMKPYDGAALNKFARVVSSCVNVLTQFNYVGDLNLEGVLGSATRKITPDMKTKWLTYNQQMILY